MNLALNKPFGVLSQFTDDQGRPTLADYVDTPGVYPVGRLDRDSEGLLLLSDDGRLQARLADPRYGVAKVYVVQVEGIPTQRQLTRLHRGVTLADGRARANAAEVLPGKPGWVWARTPPIRVRRRRPTHWLQLSVSEGRNRMVRRMTAAVGLPTLRLIRTAIGPVTLGNLGPGEVREILLRERDLDVSA